MYITIDYKYLRNSINRRLTFVQESVRYNITRLDCFPFLCAISESLVR